MNANTIINGIYDAILYLQVTVMSKLFVSYSDMEICRWTE